MQMKFLNSLLLVGSMIILLSPMCIQQKPIPYPMPTPLPDETPISPTELSLKQINPRILVGSPIDITASNDKYQGIFKTEFNSGQALWYGRWGDRWAGEYQYDFTRINKNVNWLKEAGMTPTFHMLVGPDSYMPDWLIKGTWTEAKLDSLLRGLIFSIMDSNDNKSKVESWNVINELFEDDGTYRKNMVWTQMGWERDSSTLTGVDRINTQHPVFIRKAFSYCREKTNKKLELRDFNIESNTNNDNHKRHKAIYQLLKHMLNTKIPVDAVGFQGHIIVGQAGWILDNEAFKATVEKFKALGIEVYVTELDVRTNKKTWTEKLAIQQKEDYYNYIRQAIEGGATMINTWGIQDGEDKGWIPDEYPLPWDEKLDKKPAYFGFRQALMDTKK
jgi:GH35 family endo-1,4-beta-xylanase